MTPVIGKRDLVGKRDLEGALVELKTPATRLLDLIGGWSIFVQQENDTFSDTGVSVEDVTTLYQDAGQLAFNTADVEPDEEVLRVPLWKSVFCHFSSAYLSETCEYERLFRLGGSSSD